MKTSHSMNPAAANTTATAATRSPRRLITDAPTRMFHGLFALSFIGAYLTAESEHWRLLHVTLGYGFAGLLVFRLLYGLVGPRQARLHLLWRKLSAAPTWFQDVRDKPSMASLTGRPAQNLGMAVAIALMLSLVIPLTLTGYATYNDWGDTLGGDALEELHGFFANTFLIVVLAHVGLIALLSVLRHQNMARPMLTGRIDGHGPSPVARNRRWLAVLMLLVLLAFGAWQWHASPQGLLSDQGFSTGQEHDRGGGRGDGGRDARQDEDDD